MLNLWESYDEETRQLAPKYCPNCAREFRPVNSTELVALGEGPGLVSWDCDCPECDWTGIIDPDEEGY